MTATSTTTSLSVDLNSDMGEGFGAYRMGDDEAILKVVTSANVACGFHGGDPHIMARTFARAKELGVAVGAHPGYPDLWGFGRRPMHFAPAEIEHFVAYQIGAAQALSQYAGHPITYVKPHGALGNLAQTDKDVAASIVRAIEAVDRRLVFLTFHDGQADRIAKDRGIRTCAEVFADRAYTAEGKLMNRKLPGAVLHDPEEVAARVLRMVQTSAIETAEGDYVKTNVGSICVHGDSPGAVLMAARIRERLTQAGVALRSFA
jgi:UPF0271 protein